jgi:thiamine-monophosphate kinase
MHEFEIIKKYFLKLSKYNKSSLNLNDDVFFDKEKGLVISIDTYIEGNHFLNFNKPDLVIKKIIRSSISDLICKGVNPKYYFISGSGNKSNFTKKNLIKLSKSLEEEQKKYGIFLCGGDTTFSNKLSFSVTSVGYSKKIVFRNTARVNDDIYVTGNLGDSFIGLQVLKKKLKVENKLYKYFVNKYYKPDIQIKLPEKILSFSSSSIDISDGLIADLEKMINRQKLNYQIILEDIPISKPLAELIKKHKIDKTKVVSNGDDYQVLFTANPVKSKIIIKTLQGLGVRISKIGKILAKSKKSLIVDKKGKHLGIENKGYIHKF